MGFRRESDTAQKQREGYTSLDRIFQHPGQRTGVEGVRVGHLLSARRAEGVRLALVLAGEAGALLFDRHVADGVDRRGGLLAEDVQDTHADLLQGRPAVRYSAAMSLTCWMTCRTAIGVITEASGPVR